MFSRHGIAEWFLVCLILSVNLAVGSQGTTDTTRSRYGRIPAKSRIEQFLSFPGQLAYAPIRYSVLGLGYVGVYLVETGAVRKVVSAVGGAGIVPVYAPRTGAGLRYTMLNCVGNEADLVSTATSWFDGKQLYSTELKDLELGSGLTTEIALRYRSLTEETFYGIGPETRESERLVYSSEDVLFVVSLERPFNEYLDASLDLGISNTSLFEGRNRTSASITEVYSETTLPGLKEKNRFQGTELEIRFDNTDDSGHPNAGTLGQTSAELFKDINGDKLSFWKLTLDLSQHIHLFNDRILVLRSAGEITQGLAGSDIPFNHLAEIGSYGTVRGFSRGRFRDNDCLIGSVEYRYPIWIPWAKLVDAVAFIDAGQVAHDIFEEARFVDWQVGYGGGFRFYNSKNLVAKTEIAFSSERFRVYFTLNSL